MAPRVITVSSQKGGVGKTTTAITLAHGLALRGKTVVLVDLDPQGQVTVTLGLDPGQGVFKALVTDASLNQVIRGSGRGNLWVVPGDKRTSTAQTITALERGDKSLEAVREVFVRPFNGHPDYVIFDTAPSVGGLQEGALFAAHLALIPAALDLLALYGVTGVLETLGNLVQRYQWPGQVAILPTFYDEVTRHSRENLAKLRAELGGQGLLILDPIHRATAIRDSVAEGKTLFETDPNGRPAEEYGKLVWAVLDLLKK